MCGEPETNLRVVVWRLGLDSVCGLAAGEAEEGSSTGNGWGKK